MLTADQRNRLGAILRNRAGQAPARTAPSATAPWYDPRAVRAWVASHATQACDLWREDADWRRWLASRSGDPTLAQSMPALCSKSQMADFARGRCRIAVQKDRVLAFSACPLPEGGTVTLSSAVPLAPIRKALLLKMGNRAGANPGAVVQAVDTAAKKVAASAAVKKLAKASLKVNSAVALAPRKTLRWGPAMQKWGGVRPFVGAVPLVGPAADKLLAAHAQLATVAAKADPRAATVVDRAASGVPAQSVPACSRIRALKAKAAAGDPNAKKAWSQIRAVNLHRAATAVAVARQRPVGRAVVQEHQTRVARLQRGFTQAPVQFRREAGADGKLRMVIDVGSERDATCAGFAWTSPTAPGSGPWWSPRNLYARGAAA